MVACLLVVTIIVQNVAANSKFTENPKFLEAAKLMGDSKIVGGREIYDIKRFPFIIHIFEVYKSSCGGSLLTPAFVLTACHCLARMPVGPPGRPTVEDKQFFQFVAGDVMREYPVLQFSGIQIRKAKAFHLLPRCATHGGNGNDSVYKWDIALGEMVKPFVIDENVKTITLLSTDNVDFDKKSRTLLNDDKTICEVGGWGMIRQPNDDDDDDDDEYYDNHEPLYAKVLKVVRMYHVPDEECDRIYKRKRKDVFQNHSFREHYQVCALGQYKNESDCVGDSGGPYACNGFLIGVISYGMKCASPVPSIFTLLTPLYAWVEEDLPALATALGISVNCSDDRQTCKLTTKKKPDNGSPHSTSHYNVAFYVALFIGVYSFPS